MRLPRLAATGLLVLALSFHVTAALAATAPVPPRGLRSVTSAATSTANRATPGAGMLANVPDKQVNVDPGNLVDEAGAAIAVAPSGLIGMVWNGDESQKTLWFSRSLDGGVTFQPAVRINDAVAYPPSYSVYQPDVAIGPDGTIYVVWFDYRAWIDDLAQTSPIDVYLDKSTDGGVTWGTDVLVSTNSTGTYPWHFQPYLTINPTNGNLYVSFNDYDRYFPDGDTGDISVARSVNGGASFQPKVRVDDLGAALVPQSFSAIAVHPATGDLYVAFEDLRGSSTDIYLARSTDGGQTFGVNSRVNADTTSLQQQPSLRVDGAGNVCATWFDWRTDPDPATPPNLNHILFARSPAGGAAFGTPVQVTDVSMNGDAGFNFPPRLAINPAGEIDIVWFDRRADTSLCRFDRSTNGGASFGPDLLLHADRGNYTHALPRIALRNGEPVATWIDRRNGDQTRFDIFFTRRFTVTGVDDDRPAVAPAIAAAPNPFRTQSMVRFTLPAAATARVGVRDLAGRAVRTLVDGPLGAGPQAVAWDGADDAGRALPSGVYFIEVRVGATRLRHKVVLGR